MHFARRKFSAPAALGICLIFSGGTATFAAPAKHKVGPCMADIARFCPKVPMGDGRRINCLADHLTQLAPECKKRVPVMKRLFEFGQQQQVKTEKYLQTHKDPVINAVPPKKPAPKQQPSNTAPKAQPTKPASKP